MNSESIDKLRNYITSQKHGAIFITPDFAAITDSNTLKQDLASLVQEHILEQILDDVYMKPKFSTFFNDWVAAHPDDIADALARIYHWSIAPCGNMALNMLNLSTQVPAVCSYASSGPDKTFYTTAGIKLEFRHTPEQDIVGMSYMTKLVIQALREFNQDHITKCIVNRLTKKLSDNTKAVLLKETEGCTPWIREAIVKIAKPVGSK